MRVIAIIMVVNYHVVYYTEQAESLTTQMSQRLWFGMDLFFVLSGFLIGNILIKGQTLSSGRGLLRFYVRRGFRTFPLYYFVLAALVVIDLYGSDVSTLWRELIYLTNYPPICSSIVYINVNDFFIPAAGLFSDADR
jgi:peptidoglycan/LPS O-acetylase OafA/YrhL